MGASSSLSGVAYTTTACSSAGEMGFGDTLSYAAEVILMIASITVTIWVCEKCGYENAPMRDVFCGNCGNRRPGW